MKKELLEKLRKISQVDNMPPTPVDVNIYGKLVRCKYCGRYLANDRAWKELPGGAGSNLCWGDCQNEDFTILLNFDELREIVAELDVCESRLASEREDMLTDRDGGGYMAGGHNE